MFRCRLALEAAAVLALAGTAHGAPVSSDNSPPSGGPAKPTLQLEVIRNGVDTGLIVAFHQPTSGGFTLSAADLAALGLVDFSHGDPVALDRLAGVRYRYDEPDQEMIIEAAPSALAPTVISLRGSAPPPPPTHDLGALLNYSIGVEAEGIGGPGERRVHIDAGGEFEGRLFGAFGLFSNGFDVASDGDHADTIRLDTTWTWSDRASLITVNAGDFVSGGFFWTRPVRLAGFQIRRDFALRPDMVTVPTPILSATAAAPSTLDVLLGSSTVLSREVPAGPVQVQDLPVFQGAQTARLVLRDAAGDEQLVTAAYFATPDLLRPGMLDFSGEIGFARRNDGWSPATTVPHPWLPAVSATA